MGCPELPASQAEAAARAVQVSRASGRVRQPDVVDRRVNGYKAIHKAKHLLFRGEGDIYYLKRGNQRDVKRNIGRDRDTCVHIKRQGTERERVC